MADYNSYNDVMEHKALVRYWINVFIDEIFDRGEIHDASKLVDPEKPMFDQFVPLLKSVEFGSDEYKAALAEMGKGLQHHYQNNRHHPERFENGISGMDLIDVVEMFCDWIAAAQGKDDKVDLTYLIKRFEISPQLVSIFTNTLRYLGRLKE